MKKVKNLLLVALFGVFSFAFVGIASAAPIAGSSLFARNGGPTAPRQVDMVCEPGTLTENGAHARCYLIGNLDSSPDAATSVNGFAVQVYTTEYLKIDGVYGNDALTAKAGTLMMRDSTVSTSIDVPTDAPDSVKNYKCNRGDTINIAGKPVTPLDYRCALFYTKKTQAENAFTKSSLKQGHKVEHAYSNPGLVGSFDVYLDTDKENVQECGEICYMLWEVPTKDDYDNTSCTTNPDDEKCKSTKEEYSCKEIEISLKKPDVTVTPEKPEDPTPAPDTGAFTSYAVLAAGALIAVGAIAMAKKNTKFNRL